jgi:hypothetical protein
MDVAMKLLTRQRLVDWFFNGYLNVAPPSYALEGEPRQRATAPAPAGDAQPASTAALAS